MTNSHIYCFTGNENDSICTTIIDLSKCEDKEYSISFGVDNKLIFLLREENEYFYFKASDNFERNEWRLESKLAITNLKIIDEREELELEEMNKVEPGCQGVF